MLFTKLNADFIIVPSINIFSPATKLGLFSEKTNLFR